MSIIPENIAKFEFITSSHRYLCNYVEIVMGLVELFVIPVENFSK